MHASRRRVSRTLKRSALRARRCKQKRLALHCTRKRERAGAQMSRNHANQRRAPRRKSVEAASIIEAISCPSAEAGRLMCAHKILQTRVRERAAANAVVRAFTQQVTRVRACVRALVRTLVAHVREPRARVRLFERRFARARKQNQLKLLASLGQRRQRQQRDIHHWRRPAQRVVSARRRRRRLQKMDARAFTRSSRLLCKYDERQRRRRH